LPPSNRAAGEIEQIAEDGLLADHAGGQRLDDVAGLGKGAGSCVDVDAAQRTTASFGLAHAHL
jgi:hypothetical protein